MKKKNLLYLKCLNPVQAAECIFVVRKTSECHKVKQDC